MVSPIDILLQLPLASAIVWFANAAWPWARGLRMAPEKAFVSMCLFIGLWSLLDWVFLHAPDLGTAVLVAKFRISMITLASLALFYFGRWLTHPRGLVDLLAILPVLVSLTISWTVLTRGAVLDPWGPSLVRDPVWSAVWVTQVAAYTVLSFYYLAQTLRKSTFSSGTTRTKLVAIFLALVIGAVSWIATGAYVTLAQAPTFPAYSALVLVPGLLLLVLLAPESSERLLRAFRRMMVGPARPFAAIWYHNSGRALAQLLIPGEKPLDASTLVDLTRAVDHVLSTGLPSHTGSLRGMTVGEYRLMLERGRHLTLVTLLRGRPSEALRSELRLAVRDFEAIHGKRLGTWESATEIAERAIEALDEVLNPSML